MRRVLAAVGFALLSATQNFRRNLAISLAGVCTIGLILVMLGGMLLLVHSADLALDQVQQGASTIRVYLVDTASLPSVLDLKARLEQDPRVSSVTFTTKDAAIHDPNSSNDLTVGAAELGYNPLPASLDIHSRSIADLDGLNALAKQDPIADTKSKFTTDYNPEVVTRLQTFRFWVGAIGGVLSLILSFISLVIIMNTIRTAVFLRRAEIEIMKLVGATDWFVRGPFILEGMMGGLLASVLAGVVLVFGYQLAAGGLRGLSFQYDAAFANTVVIGLAGAGLGLGALGSYLGIRRFLHV